MSGKFVGDGDLKAPYTKNLRMTTFATDADAAACLAIQYMPNLPDGGSTSVMPHSATWTMDGNGAGTQGRITLTVNYRTYSSNSDSTKTFTIDFDESARSAWSSDAAVAYTLKELVDLINESDGGGTNGNLLDGFKCWALNAPHDMILNGAAQFQDESATYIMTGGGTSAYTSVLKLDHAVHTIDSDYVAYLRIGGSPEEPRDRGPVKFIDLYGAIGTDTGATVRIYGDDIEDYVAPTATYATDLANHELFLQVAAANVSANSGTTPGSAPDVERASRMRTPVIVELKGDTGAGQTVNLNIQLQQAS